MRYPSLLLFLSGVVGVFARQATEELPDFSRQILPLLSDNCFQCHGPDANHREADLRLDLEDHAKAPRDGYLIIDPGSVETSELIYHVTTDDEYDRMLPLDSNKSLEVGEIELLKRWIDSGAEWGRHWAFDSIERPFITQDAAHPVDGLVAEALAEEGLSPSPAYGERMAWDWMEIARYADTNGYQADNIRTMWPRRSTKTCYSMSSRFGNSREISCPTPPKSRSW